MSLREEIGEIYWAIDEGDHRIDEIINKVLDAAVEAAWKEMQGIAWGPDEVVAAINKLRGD